MKSGEGLSDAHKAAIQEAIAKLCGDEFAAVLPDDLDASIDGLSASVLNGSANPEEKTDLNWGGFGAILPDDFDAASLDDLPTSALDSSLSSLVAEAVRSAPDEVTPEALKNIIIEKATPSLARSGVDLALGEAFTKLGFNADPGGIVRAFTSRHPDFLSRCSDAAKFIAAEPLRDMLRNGPVSKESLLDMLGQMAGHYEASSHVFFPADILNDMGSDETGAIQRYTLQIFFARNPDLKGALPREIAADVDDTAAAEATRMVTLAGGSYDLPPEERTAFMQQYANAVVTYSFVNNMMPKD